MNSEALKASSSFFAGLSIRALFCLALIPGVLAAAALLALYLGEKRSDLEFGALQTTTALAQAIDKDVESVIRTLEVLRSSAHLRSGDLKAFHEQAREIVAGERIVSVIVLIDKTGQRVLSTLEPWGTRLPKAANLELLRKTLDSGRPMVSDLYFSGTPPKPYVAIQIPIQVDGGQFALTMAIQADRLTGLLAKQNLPEGWVATLVDGKGKVIARSMNFLQSVGKDATPDYREQTGKASEGTFPSRSLDGVSTFVAFKHLENANWVVSIGAPRSVIYSRGYWSLAVGGFVIVILTAMGALVAFAFSRKLGISLQELERASAMAAHGETDIVVPLNGPKEIVQLAERFNEMQASRRAMEATQRRIKTALILLNEANTALLLADEEQKLLAEVCRSIVEKGGYLMAWVGYGGSEEDKIVRPLASSGNEQGYLRNMAIGWPDKELRETPTATAVRAGVTQVSKEGVGNPAMGPWREEMVKIGCHATVAMPLILEGGIIGALTIHAAEPDAFGEEEIGLLEKLTSNLAFGIERLRTRNRLDVANKELQAFTYAASHDMKAPLQRVVTFSRMLENSIGGTLSGDDRTLLGFIRDNSRRIMILIEDLLEHAHIEQLSVALQPVRIQDALQAILEEKQSEFADVLAELSVDVPDVAVNANPLALSQALRNLISNAVKYSARSTPPIIQIGGCGDDDTFRLWIRDNGIGFPMVYHDRIFQIFQRLHTYAEIPGSGVGLALVKKAMDRMGGRVWAESAPGEGATFYIELARARSDHEEPPKASWPRSVSQPPVCRRDSRRESTVAEIEPPLTEII